MPQLGNVERRPGEEENGIEHEEHLDRLNFSPRDDVHCPANRVAIGSDPPDVADHPLVE